ncbi:MAG: protein kinase [Gemmatimonadetes bacterium]|nr:protein kinase [Gemmatimonadota bacterium]
MFEKVTAALADRYPIEREIGKGGMATVYLADDPKHRRKVAVKILRPDLAASLTSQRFLREIEMAAGLVHPNIVPVYDSGSAGGFLYYVMPFIEGESLRHRLDSEKRLPIDEAVRVAHVVAGALAYAHRQSILHRDIKPGNILFVEGHALITDFGIGKAMCDACGDDDITLIGGLVGTPNYMSPEQAAGGPVDFRSDVYSLGCVWFEMLTGEPPYAAENGQATIARHAIDPIPSVRAMRPDIPEHLDAVMQRALAKRPDDRFQSAKDMAEALEQPAALPAKLAANPVAVRTSVRRGRIRAAALAAIAIVSIVGAGVWLTGTGVFREDGVRIESLAVLPFTNLSGDPEQQYFVDGMHDLLIAELAQIGSLMVISRTSVMRFRDHEQSLSEIARALQVDAIVEGSVFRAGDSVRITAQLVVPDPERHLWAQAYERSLEDLFALQSEVAMAVARAIEAELTPQDEARLVSVTAVDHEAHDAYLRARYHHAQGTVEGFQQAIRYYTEAIDRSPDFAVAHAGLALSLHLLGVYGGGPVQQTEPRAKRHAEAALQLDEGLAEAHAVLAGIRSMFDWDWPGAERAYRRALEVDRNSASARQWYAYHLSAMGRGTEAVGQARRGLELDPLNPMSRVVLADQLVNARRYVEAIEVLDHALELEPGFDRALELLEWIHAHQERYDDAVALRVRRLTGPGAQPGGDVAAGLLRMAYAADGPRGYLQWRLERLRREAEVRYVGPSAFAAIHTALGEADAAFEWLERALAAREGVAMLKVWPGYDPLRADPRFAELLERMRFPD